MISSLCPIISVYTQSFFFFPKSGSNYTVYDRFYLIKKMVCKKLDPT